MCMVGEPVTPVVDLVSRNGSWLVSGAGVVLDPRRYGISPVGPVGGVVWPGARDEGLAVGGFTDERR